MGGGFGMGDGLQLMFKSMFNPAKDLMEDLAKLL